MPLRDQVHRLVSRFGRHRTRLILLHAVRYRTGDRKYTAEMALAILDSNRRVWREHYAIPIPA